MRGGAVREELVEGVGRAAARDARAAAGHVLQRQLLRAQVHRLDITDPSEQRVVGSLENIYPGLSCRTPLCGQLIDNYRLTFPPDASPAQKATLLARLYPVGLHALRQRGRQPLNRE